MSGSVGSEKTGEQKFERSALAVARIVLRIALSILFFFASFMKGGQLLTEPSLGEGLFNSRLFITVLTLGEFALALWLLFGFLPRLTFRIMPLLHIHKYGLDPLGPSYFLKF